MKIAPYCWGMSKRANHHNRESSSTLGGGCYDFNSPENKPTHSELQLQCHHLVITIMLLSFAQIIKDFFFFF